MKFAFLIMGAFDCKIDNAQIGNGSAQIVGVSNMEEAVFAAKELYENGIDCIELCGAFGKNGAKEIVRATENRIPIGYITHLPEQDELYRAVFS